MARTNKFRLLKGGTLSLVGTITLPEPTGAWHVTAQVVDLGFNAQPDNDLTVTLGTGVLVPDTNPLLGPIYAYPILIEATAAQTVQWAMGDLLSNVRAQDDSEAPVVIPTFNYMLELVQGATRGPVLV